MDGTCKRISRRKKNILKVILKDPKKNLPRWRSWDHQMPLALNQARLSLPSSAKHVNHVTRTTALVRIPLFEAKPSQAASISNCPYACAVITVLYREMIQLHEMCRYFTTLYNFIDLSFYAFNSGDAKIPSSSFHNFKSSWFWGGWHTVISISSFIGSF